jgi:hypothetical protein
MHPGFAAASDQRGNWRARHVNRSSADLPNVQVDDAAGPHLREGASYPGYPLSCF